jgi:hypothetical protein
MMSRPTEWPKIESRISVSQDSGIQSQWLSTITIIPLRSRVTTWISRTALLFEVLRERNDAMDWTIPIPCRALDECPISGV